MVYFFHLEEKLVRLLMKKHLLTIACVVSAIVTWTFRTASAQTKLATATTLTVTSGASGVTTVGSGKVVTLTASVSSGTNAITIGQVNFCDTSSTYCTDIHLLGTSQLTINGAAVLKLRPGIGSHTYKAVFIGTNSYATSSSTSSSLTVTGVRASTTTIAQSGNPGNYTLTATVAGIVNSPDVPAPTGMVSFIDITTNNLSLGTAALGSGSVAGLAFTNSSSPSATQPNAVAVADFNGDGFLDLAVSDATAGPGSLAILLGNGDGTFTASTESPAVGSYPDSIAVGDFNSDGIPDLAVTSVDQSNVTILIGNGDGTFSTNSPNLSITSGTPQSLAAGDFNGDGIVDLAVVSSNSVLIFLGNGNGTFTQTAVSPATGASPINVAVGDFNSDGKADLAVTNSVSNTVTILLGNGDGTFKAMAVSPATGGSPDGLAIADFNGDGVPDIAVTNYSGELSGNAVAILLGNGDGTFGTAVPYSAPGLSFHSVVVADFNGDGVADLAVGEVLNGNFPVFLGQGDGTFASAITVDAWSELSSGYLAAGDFDGDGVSDLALPNQGGTVPILLTQPTLSVTGSIGGISPTGPSPQEVYASYLGDANYKSSISGTTILTILAATPTISPNAGAYGAPQMISISDSTTGAAIYYSESGFQTSTGVPYTGPITLSGTGNETISAYAVAENYAQSLTASATYTLAQDFTFTTPTGASSSATIQPGGQATFSLSITPPAGSTTAAQTTFAVTGLPTGATATFSPTSVPANSGPTNVTLTVSVPPAMRAQTVTHFALGMVAFVALGMILLPLSGRRMRKLFQMPRLMLMVLALIIVAECGCGGSTGSKGSSGQTYTLTVTANSGPLSHAVNLTLTVQ